MNDGAPVARGRFTEAVDGSGVRDDQDGYTARPVTGGTRVGSCAAGWMGICNGT